MTIYKVLKTDKARKCNQIFDIFPDYTRIHFINDMDHIITYHKELINNHNEKDTFYSNIHKCKLSNCRAFELNESKNECIDTETMVSYQFVQEYHVFLFHANKRGNILRGNSLRPTRYIHSRSIIHPRSNRFMPNVSISNGSISNFPSSEQKNEEKSSLTSIKEEQDEKSTELSQNSQQQKPVVTVSNNSKITVPPDMVDETQNIIFSMGHRFEYHRWNKDDRGKVHKNPWYVGCKYKNLKCELIDDPEKKMSNAKWNMLIKFSTQKEQSIHSKKYVAHDSQYGWTTKLGKPISTARVLAIVLYTNYDSLQSQLKQSFVATHSTTKYPPKEAKKQHSRFGHWSKLLRSSVDCFGKKMIDTDRFYRGLDRQFKFKLFSCTFRGPISTSIDWNIAKSFANDGDNLGIVVEIRKPLGYDKSRYLNVKMWSSYKCEEEHLFNGADNWLNITTINYQKSFIADQDNAEPLLLFQAITSRSHYVNIPQLIQKSKKSKNVIERLNEMIINRNDKNDYITSLLFHYCSQTVSFKIGLEMMKALLITAKEKGDKYENDCNVLLNFFFDDSDLILSEKKLFVNFFKCIQLFPNLNEIIIDFGGWHLWLDDDNKTWNNLLEYITKTKSDRGLKFFKVKMKRFPRKHFPTNALIKKMEQGIHDTKWRVYHETIKGKIKTESKLKRQNNGNENKENDDDINGDRIIIEVARPKQHILSFVKGDCFDTNKRQRNLSPMLSNTFYNPASNHLAYSSSMRKKKKQKSKVRI